MDEEDHSQAPPPWMSIKGQPLHLDAVSNVQGQCASIDSYEKLNQLGEGTYGTVHRARSLKDGTVIALKHLHIPPSERQNGVPITSLREISLLRSLTHQNIVNVVDVAVGHGGMMEEVWMVMEYAEQDLANLMDSLGVRFSMSQVKCLFGQLLEGLDYLHRNDVIHRDVKMQNILLTAKGVLKLADFGMARSYSARPLTPGVVTIWYRAPELLLGTKYYTPSIDLWSAGLVLAELLLSTPCLPGETPIEQLSLTIKLLGSPTPEDLAALSAMGCPDLVRWQREGYAAGRADNLERRFLGDTSPETVQFLKGLLAWHPHARWTAAEALGIGRSRRAEMAEKWWKESPRAVERALLPTYPEIRNQGDVQNVANAGPAGWGANEAVKTNRDYVFDFGESGASSTSLRRPSKRPRAR